VPQFAAVITFDDLDASLEDINLDGMSPYQGFTWKNVSAYAAVPGFPGFNNGIVSPNNAAYSGGEILGDAVVGKILSPTAFDFTSAYLGARYYDDLTVTLQGFSGTTLKFTQSVTVNTSGAKLFTFDFANINELDFFASRTAFTTDPFGCGPSNCTQFTLDNIAGPGGAIPIPEPSCVSLVSFGIIVFLTAMGLERLHRGTDTSFLKG
jgi:hypothetical protein